MKPSYILLTLTLFLLLNLSPLLLVCCLQTGRLLVLCLKGYVKHEKIFYISYPQKLIPQN